MNRADFRALLAYSDTCWRALGETLATAPNVWNETFTSTSEWNSIRLLLTHCIGAEERLVVRRLQNFDVPVRYEDRGAPEWDGLYAEQRTIRAGTYAYLESVTDADLVDEEHPALSATAERGALTRADVLFQVVNHENYHRGQVIMTLQRLGLDPPNFDFMVLKEFKPS